MANAEHAPMDDHECSEMPSMAVAYSGPREHHDVVVNGWQVPFLEAHPQGEDRVLLVLDQRLGAEFSVLEAERLIPFIADAIAVSLGYGCHPGPDTTALPTPFPPIRPRRITSLVAASVAGDDEDPTA
jgi:hypothetical protein